MVGGYREAEWQLRPCVGLCRGILQHWQLPRVGAGTGKNWEHVPEELASASGPGTRIHTTL